MGVCVEGDDDGFDDAGADDRLSNGSADKAGGGGSSSSITGPTCDEIMAMVPPTPTGSLA